MTSRHMPLPKTRKVDLNLLTVLDALIEEGSVSRAATRLRVTQPAVSLSLAKLRDQIGDPLFVRSARGMEPTERALELVQPIRAALDKMRDALDAARGFDPATFRGYALISAVDYATHLYIPALAQHVHEHARRLQQRIRRIDESAPMAASAAAANNLVFTHCGETGPELRRQRLSSEKWKVIFRRGHPAIGRRLSLQQYCELPHTITLMNDQNTPRLIDQMLAERGLARRIAVTLPNSVFIPMVNAASDCISTVPERLARFYRRYRDLEMIDCPLPLPPAELFLVWHRRFDAHPVNRWLREQAVLVANQVWSAA